ncbi:uncharacterized protein LOC132705874 [Cylas formicarius]|uniref:uncharacterized protein LOC132705874 n=1 Tax=Cylas formicarius TaxID=197179 RepID=UPI002958DE29|nr:uncharacterized protein LOC132705874 [Cylas formicarius]
MSKLSKLLQVTDAEKRAVLEEFDTTDEQFEENVKLMREWLEKSEHLPKENNDNKLKVSLLNNKMSLEKAKQCLEGYYRVRTTYSEEFFDKLLPNTEIYKQAKPLTITVPLPKLTPDLCRITVFRFNDPQGNASDAFLYSIMALMMAEIRVAQDCFASNIILVDMTGFTWKNMVKYTPSIYNKLLNILHSINLRIKAIHIVNLSPLIDQLMRLFQALLPLKLQNRIQTHHNFDTLHQHIPKECLPVNYDGKLKSVEELYDEWCQQLEEMEDTFKKLLTAKATKKLELDESSQANLGLGVDGSFKKLAID